MNLKGNSDLRTFTTKSKETRAAIPEIYILVRSTGFIPYFGSMYHFVFCSLVDLTRICIPGIAALISLLFVAKVRRSLYCLF